MVSKTVKTKIPKKTVTKPQTKKTVVKKPASKKGTGKPRGPYKKKVKAEPVVALAETKVGKFLSTTGSRAHALIKSLSSLSDQELAESYTAINEMAHVSFITRGSIGYEAIKRATNLEALSKEKGKGADTIIKEVCDQIPGADRHTMQEDAKIFDNFGDYLVRQLADDVEGILPREFYILACKTSKTDVSPQDMLTYFEDKRRATDGYYVGHARRDTKKINTGKSLKEVEEEDTLERAQAVKAKTGGKPAGITTASVGGVSSDSTQGSVSTSVSGESPKAAMTNISIPNTEELRYFIGKIIEKYGSTHKWILQRAKEEFGQFKAASKKK